MGSSKKVYKHKKRRHRSRRALISRICLLLMVMGSLCILLGLVFLISSWLIDSARVEKQFWIGLGYVGCGSLLIGIKYALKGIVHLMERRAMKRSRERAARHHSPRSRREGSVLVLTLVLIALLGGLVLHAQVAARQGLQRASTLADRQQLYLAAQDATLHAARVLAQDDQTGYDHLSDPWAQSRETTLPSGISIRTEISDATARFSLNNLAAQRNAAGRSSALVFTDILTLCGDFSPLDRVDALKDWVDADERGFREADFYQEEASIKPANRPLFTWPEILDIDGFDRAYFQPRAYTGTLSRENPFEQLEVIPDTSGAVIPVNINTTRRTVLAGILGIGHEAIAERLIAMRSIKPLPNLATAQVAANPFDLAPLLPYLAVKSDWFIIRARAFQEGSSLDLAAVVHRTEPGHIDIVQWVF